VILAASYDVPTNIIFGVVAAGMIYSAFRVVTTKNVVHAAFFLVAVLAGVGVNFLLLQAEFVALTQVLVYIGAIVVLFLFGIMLTRAPLGRSDDLDNRSLRPAGVATALLLLVVIAYSLIRGFSDTQLILPANAATSTADVADSIFSTYLFPFELVSMLLTAALIGAIVLARRD
jgi:NADH-quinone oxidoreductase subunit J